MNFYSLVEKDTQELLADIIEFENGEFVGYFYRFKQLQAFINKDDMDDYIKFNRDLDGLDIELIKDGVEEEE